MKNVQKIILLIVVTIVSSNLRAQESKGKSDGKPVKNSTNREGPEKNEEANANLSKKNMTKKGPLDEQMPLKHKPKRIILEEQTLNEQDEKATALPAATDVEVQEKLSIETEEKIKKGQPVQIESKENKAIIKDSVKKKSKVKKLGAAKKIGLKKVPSKSKKTKSTTSAKTGVKKSKATLR